MFERKKIADHGAEVIKIERYPIGDIARHSLNESGLGAMFCQHNTSRPGYAHISHAMTGWLAMQFLHRDPPEEPHGPGIVIGDTTAGLTAFGAICAALYRREKTGEGEHNEEILKRVLGYDRERIESLKEKGVIIQ